MEVRGSATGIVDTGDYPDYEEDEEIFTRFLNEHKIYTTSTPSSPSPSEELYEPSSTTPNLRLTPCYPPLLHRILTRRFYPSPSSSSRRPTRRGDDNNNNDETHSTRVFIIEIPLGELVAWDGVRGADLAGRAMRNTLRYLELFCRVIDRVLADTPHGGEEEGARDSIDILHQQRLAQQAARTEELEASRINNPPPEAGDATGLLNDATILPPPPTDEFPPALTRRYELRILPLGRPGSHPPFLRQHSPPHVPPPPPPPTVSLRNIRSQSLGKLVSLTGLLVRASDVKPCCTVATYTCDACGYELYQVVPHRREFMPMRVCTSPVCQAGRAAGGTLQFQTRGSKFEKFQECRVQELPDQVPMGHVPRSIAVYCRGELTRKASPGDVVTVDGIFLPQRVAESGYRAMTAGLVSTTFLQAQRVEVHRRSYDERDDTALRGLSTSQINTLDTAILTIAQSPDPIALLSSSLAPEIYGHPDIKRALLLQSVGGCTRTLPDGLRIRGDVHICLMGDPGVAKSQLLKHVASITPRGVYTTGKGSSGVGLTAAVTKDVATGEMALEGGALVLADRGVCAIDEFDKMEEGDRTAIHEVMEQQTVSIAKAGIVASLNARTSVLAAANPLYGRYNRRRSVSENVNLPNSLLSRFDLMFLILDVADVDRDMALARHVTYVHQNEGLDGGTAAGNGNTTTRKRKKPTHDNDDDPSNDDPPPTIDDEDPSDPTTTTTTPSDKFTPVPPKILREYIRRARQFHPIVPPNVAPYIVEAYVGLRMQDKPSSSSSRTPSNAGDQTVMTARQLLSILRLGQALARLRFSDYVAREDVDEAIRLTHMSKASLVDDFYGGLQGGDGEGGKGAGGDVTSKIFQIIKDHAAISRKDRMELKLCEAITLRKGFTAQQLQTCLEEYQALDVIQLNSAGTYIHFL